MRTYFCETELPKTEIKAGISSGTLQFCASMPTAVDGSNSGGTFSEYRRLLTSAGPPMMTTTLIRMMTMIDREQLDDCHKLALTVAPELKAQPLYVMAAEELAGLPCGAGCLGWAADDMFFDRSIADKLGARYEGPGNLFVIDFAAIEAAANPGQLARCVLNVALHEVAHIVPVIPVLEPADTPRVRELQLQRMEATWKAPDLAPGDEHDCHDLKFFRRCVHLFVRAALAGYEIPIFQLFGASIWTTGAEHFLPYTLPEALRMQQATFKEIEATPPPPAIVEMWEADVKSYRQIVKRENQLCQAS